MSITSFNQNLIQFLEDLNNTFPDYPINIENFKTNIENNESHYLNQFLNDVKPIIKDIANFNQSVFVNNEITLLDEIYLSTYWKRNISSETKQSIINYLHVLYIISYNHCKNTNKNFEKTIDNITNMDVIDEDDDTEIYLKLINNIKAYKKSKQNPTNNKTTEEDFDPLKDIFGMEGGGGLIGEIAKDITQELSENMDDLGNPMDMLGMLMGGGSKNGGGGLMNIIQKVGTKLQDKLSSSEIDQNQLLNEAGSIMNHLNGSGFDFANLAKTMGVAPPNMNINQNNDKMKMLSRRARLQKKLQQKRLELAEAQNTIQETVDSDKKKRRRRRKKKKSNITETC